MKGIVTALLALAGCSGNIHLYEKTGSYSRAAFDKQAQRRDVPPVRPLGGADVQIIGQNYAATFARGGASASAASAGPAASGAAAGAAAEAGGQGIIETTPLGR